MFSIPNGSRLGLAVWMLTFACWLAVSSTASALHIHERGADSTLKTERENEGSSQTKYLRVLRDAEGTPTSLETSITRFKSGDGKLLVDLIAVVHIGERNYYRKLDHQFSQYDALLYELVAPEGQQIPRRNTSSKRSHPIAWLQDSMKNQLGLHAQLDHIDYTQANFVHADLSPAAMQRKMAARGETVWSVGFSAMSEIMEQQQSGAGPDNPINSFEDLMDVLASPLKLKRLLAEQFVAGEGLDAGLGKTLNRLLVTDRNPAAIKVLREQMNDGKTKVGIFYGAAHMPDFEKRLKSQFNLKQTQQAWVQAWDLSSAPRPKQRVGGSLLESFIEILDGLEE